MLLKLIDGGILEIEDDKSSIGGCPTCDFASSYSRYYNFYLTTMNIYIEAEKSYDYPLSDGFMMKLLLNNVDDIKMMTEVEFSAWLEKKVREEGCDVDFRRFQNKGFK